MSRPARVCWLIRSLLFNLVWLLLAHLFAPLAEAQEQQEQQDPIVRPQLFKPRDNVFLASRFALYGGVALDLGTTWHAMSRGRVEAHPLLGQSRLRQGAIVIGSAVALDFVSRKLHRAGHTRVAKVLNFMIGGEHTLAAAYNLSH